jgi:cell division septation protein DedD
MTPVPAPESATPPPVSTEGFVPAPREAVAPVPGEAPAPAAAPSYLPGADQTQSSLTPDQQFIYIVQLGSFVDKDKADQMKNRLTQKGYNALVKPLKHNVLGRIYVIQLKPVNSFSKASTLMTQLGGEVEGEPVIIKVPVAPKPADLTPSPTAATTFPEASAPAPEPAQ